MATSDAPGAARFDRNAALMTFIISLDLPTDPIGPSRGDIMPATLPPLERQVGHLGASDRHSERLLMALLLRSASVRFGGNPDQGCVRASDENLF
jgi:hypothetical protein